MNDSSGTSRILTLVFTDLADSTALKTRRGDQAVGGYCQLKGKPPTWTAISRALAEVRPLHLVGDPGHSSLS